MWLKCGSRTSGAIRVKGDRVKGGRHSKIGESCIISGQMRIAVAALSLFLASLAGEAAAQSNTPGMPVVNQVVSADFSTETFSFRWRAPTNAQNVVGYHIRRQQNVFVSGLNANSHPSRCDSLTDSQWRWSDADNARTDFPQLTGGVVVSATVFAYSEQTRPPSGNSHGNCYRWHVAAFTQNQVGNANPTNPILSRSNAGQQGCNAGQAKPWIGGANPYSSACTQHVEAGEWCHDNGGTPTFSTVRGNYECHASSITCLSGYINLIGVGCILGKTNAAPSTQCPALSEFNLDHRECACRGLATPKSSGTGCECTVAGAEGNCECPGGSSYNPQTNACECPAGETLVGRAGKVCIPDAAAQIYQACGDAGWTAVPSDTLSSCLIPITYAGSNLEECGIFVKGGSEFSTFSVVPCVDFFGDPPVFPRAADHPGERFVANCDEDENGNEIPNGYPPEHNLDGETECGCAEGYVGPWPNCVELTPALVCTLQGWTHDSGTGKCRIPLTSGGTDYDGCFLSGGGSPQCADVFGEGLEIPAKLTGLALTLFNGFDSRKDPIPGMPIIPYVTEGARVWRDAVAARHNGEEDYDVALLANYDGNARIENRIIIATLSPVFIENGIPFGADGFDTAAGRATLAAAFEMIPVRGAFVFNCGAGATPSGANTLSATECECGGALPIRRGRGVCSADCPDGMVAVEGECLEATAANKCKAGGWDTGGGLCIISVADFQSNASTMTAALLFNQCALGESEFLPECAEVFGADLDFPRKPPGEIPRYPFNCDADGTRGLVPATMNTANADGQWTTEECMCADSTGVRKGAVSLSSGGGYAPMVGGRCEVCAADEFRDGEDCVKACSAGKVTLGRMCVTAAEKCEARGWDKTTGAVCHFGNRGDYLIYDVSGGFFDLRSGGLCNITSGSVANEPDCSDVFGPNLEFPQIPSPAAFRRYVYNCDPDGTRGLTPATHSHSGAIDCVCEDSFKVRRGAESGKLNGDQSVMLGGVCECPNGKVESGDGLSCVCPANMVAEGEGCACPAGTTDLQGYCVSAAEKAGAEKCTEAGWTFADGACAIPVSTGGTVSAGCQIGAGESGGSGVSCADAFGEGFGFPAKPSSLFAVAAYVYDCVGDTTPSGANENGETTCACPGSGMVYVDGDCVEGTAENKCKAKGWEVMGEDVNQKFCAINIVNGLVGLSGGVNRFLEGCLLTENPRPGDDGCHLEFGLDFNFPQRPADGGSPHYAINCGTASGGVSANNGLLPAGMADGATDCYCGSGATRFGATTVGNGAGVTLRYDGVCLSGEAAQGAGACEGAGWSLTSDSKGWQCAVPVMRGTLSTGASEGCYLSGVATVALPQCSDVFGSGFAFPATTGTAVTFVFECGEKMVPAGVNLTGATACACAATDENNNCICGGGKTDDGEGGCECPGPETHYDLGDVCVPNADTDADLEDVAQEELCGAFGGLASDEGEGRVCKGLDKAGTFCILNPTGTDPAFPCRGLFKHLRRCNGEYNRPALNPFLCGPRCEGMARGRHCL